MGAAREWLESMSTGVKVMTGIIAILSALGATGMYVRTRIATAADLDAVRQNAQRTAERLDHYIMSDQYQASRERCFWYRQRMAAAPSDVDLARDTMEECDNMEMLRSQLEGRKALGALQ